MKVLLLGAGGKVGTALAPRLAAAGHDVTPAGRGDAWEPAGHDAAVDFTVPGAVRAQRRALPRRGRAGGRRHDRARPR